MIDRPPIRIMTRLLAELQTSIIAYGLPLTAGNLDRFAILSLIVRQTWPDRHAAAPRGVPILSLAGSLTKPYETVRRQVGALAQARLCNRTSDGVGWTKDLAAGRAIEDVLVHSHDALVRFIDDLGRLGVALPPARVDARYDPSAGMMAAVDIMLSVLDGNRRSHAEWVQLVIFSAVLAINVHRFARDPVVSRHCADETAPAPPALIMPAMTADIRRLFAFPETSVRRHLATMTRDGRLIRDERGWTVSETWLNQPGCVAVSRESFSSLRRVLQRLAAAGFPFSQPRSAYRSGRPGDVVDALTPDRKGAPPSPGDQAGELDLDGGDDTRGDRVGAVPAPGRCD